MKTKEEILSEVAGLDKEELSIVPRSSISIGYYSACESMDRFADQQTQSLRTELGEKDERIKELEEVLTELKDGLLKNHKKNNYWYNLVFNTLK